MARIVAERGTATLRVHLEGERAEYWSVTYVGKGRGPRFHCGTKGYIKRLWGPIP